MHATYISQTTKSTKYFQLYKHFYNEKALPKKKKIKKPRGPEEFIRNFLTSDENIYSNFIQPLFPQYLKILLTV